MLYLAIFTVACVFTALVRTAIATRLATFITCVFASWFLLQTATAAAVVQQQVDYASLGQNMWAPGPASPVDFTKTLADLPFSGSAHLGTVKSVFGAKIGAEAGVSVRGDVGLGFQAHLTTGDVSVKLPVNYSLTVPDPNTLAPGQSYQIASAYTLLGGEISTHSPQGSWGLYLNGSVHADANGRICAGPCASGQVTLADKTFQTRLFGASLNESSLSADSSSGLHGSLGFPIVNTQGSLSNGQITSTGKDQFASAGLDLSKAITDKTGIPLSGSANFGIGSIGFKLLDADAGITLSASQSFQFKPIPMIDLIGSDGSDRVFEAGSTINLKVPESGAPVTFTPTFFLDDSFTEKTDLDVAGYLKLAALQGDLHVAGIGGSIGPLYQHQWDLSLGSINVTSGTWALGGFGETKSYAFTVTPTPELPSVTYLLMGAGLLLVGVMRRANRISV
ncbi:MAG: hypothetical protein M3Y72_27185 [Acidobacteriota bacterium]|nr:hypothetical protein [Acidobacteriota bacterium]